MSSIITMSVCAICSRLEMASRKSICTSCEQTIVNNKNYQHDDVYDSSSNTNVDAVSNKEKIIDDFDSNIDESTNNNCNISNEAGIPDGSIRGTCTDIDICANCGKEGREVTNVCHKCKSVKYCNAACKKKHRKKHKKDCERRMAELHDEALFKQPPPREDCPICFIRMPLLDTGSKYMACCGKIICTGCMFANAKMSEDENKIQMMRLHSGMNSKLCPFCRTPTPVWEDEMVEQYRKRSDLNDAVAICTIGQFYQRGIHGYPQNHAKALQHWRRAEELGCTFGCGHIATAYQYGEGLEIDMKKSQYYYELAAIGGAMEARHNLGGKEAQAGNIERALKHFTIAAAGGYKVSLKVIQIMYTSGHATKDDYAKALREYQAYENEIESIQRDEAAAFNDDWKYIFDSSYS